MNTEPNDWKPVRAAFVTMIREENFYSDWSKQSLRAHWAGKDHGFADESLQRRYKDFTAGWKARETKTLPMPQPFSGVLDAGD